MRIEEDNREALPREDGRDFMRLASIEQGAALAHVVIGGACLREVGELGAPTVVGPGAQKSSCKVTKSTRETRPSVTNVPVTFSSVMTIDSNGSPLESQRGEGGRPYVEDQGHVWEFVRELGGAGHMPFGESPKGVARDCLFCSRAARLPDAC